MPTGLGIEIAAKLSVQKFPEVEAPLILDIVTAVLQELDRLEVELHSALGRMTP